MIDIADNPSESEADTDLWFDPPLPETDPEAPPWAVTSEDAPAPDWTAPEAWVAAEVGAGRALADAVDQLSRLDERLRMMPSAEAEGARALLARREVTDLLWAEGIRMRPERLALVEIDRMGRSSDEDQVLARALWASRRMTTWTQDISGPAVLRDLLGLEGRPHDDPEPLFEMGTAWLDPSGLADWWTVIEAADTHPLTRAGMGFHLWRGFGLSRPGQMLEPAVVAGKLLGQGALRFVPLAPTRAPAGRDAAARLTDWYGLIRGAAQQARMHLDRREDWRLRAVDATAGMHGKAAPALVDLLAAYPVVSAKMVGRLLGVTPTQARNLLNRFEAKDLLRELTGQGRFRFWEARF